jgi:fructose-1-phosphate kinase PfkB-like protein
MLLTVTLNPCVHRYLLFREQSPPLTVVRLVRERTSSGGKGLNAARVVARLGGQAVALSTQSGPVGEMLRQCLANEQVDAELVEVGKPTRLSTCLYDLTNERFREFLEEGSDVTLDEADQLRQRFAALLPRVSTVTVNGSTPAGNLAALPREFVAAARAAGKRVVLDAYGPAALAASQVPPHWLRANLDEMAGTYGVRGAAELASFFERSGADGLLVSDGARELHCLCFAKEPTTRGARGRVRHLVATPPKVAEVNAVGSGDALTGAFALALDQGRTLEEAIALGAAAGSANAEQLLVCEFEESRARELAAQVAVREVA